MTSTPVPNNPAPAESRLPVPLAPGYYPAQQQPMSPLPVVLLHGWGADSRVWGEFAGRLNQTLSLVVIDLPGFGQNQSLAQSVEALLPQLPERAFIVGWSLGGMVATAIAERAPDRVAGLVTLAANARFAASPSWPTALAEETFG